VPEEAGTDNAHATPDQMARLEEMFVRGEVKVQDCDYITTRLVRCVTKSCASIVPDWFFSSSKTHCPDCYAEMQQDLAEEERGQSVTQ
jgi:hypothetical protein